MLAKRYYPGLYKQRLPVIMQRLGATEFSCDYTSSGAWVSFSYQGQVFRLEYGAANGQPASSGAEILCKIIQMLDNLPLDSKPGILDLQSWVEGCLELPWPEPLPDCFRELGFTSLPAVGDEVDEAFAHTAMSAGSSVEYCRLQAVRNACLDYLDELSKMA